jgi:hypothetical protein
MRFVIACLVFEALLMTGCMTTEHITTLSTNGVDTGQAIYRISEETAFATALHAYAVLYPKLSVDDIVDGSRRGYSAGERMSRTFDYAQWHHRLLVVPATGTDASGADVHGYWYDYSVPMATKMRMGLLQFIRARLDATGTAVVVTNLRDGKYETDGRAHLALKRVARDIRPVIYGISEETAFTTALDACAALLPKQSVDDIVDGNRRGYRLDESFGATRWHHRMLVVPAVGTDASGNEVHGYWYDYSSDGDSYLHFVLRRRMALLQFIRARLDATGTGVVVTNLRDDKYETDGRAYLGLKRDARDIRPNARPPAEK